MAVTKGRSPERIRSVLLENGHTVLGENRVQEWREKQEAVGAGVTWHLVGHLQRNKVKYCRAFELIHSLDSERLALALEEEGAKREHLFRTLVQVNVSGEASKYGVAPGDVARLVEAVRSLPHVRVEGLMTIAPLEAKPDRLRALFAELRAMRDTLALTALSMGMSADFEIAVEEGATLVRVGSALFESSSP